MMTEATGQRAASGEIVLGQNNYGKGEVRVVKVTRNPGRHEIRDMDVAVAMEGDFEAAHVKGDNTGLIATDTVRNTIYALAKEHSVESIESFGLKLVDHFIENGPKVTGARADITEFPWTRIEVNGQGHEHSFVRGSGVRKARVTGDESGDRQVEAGIDDLLILKTTNSGWEGYLKDRYTTLPETNDRILATIVTAKWSYGNGTDLDFNRLWRSVRDQTLETFTDYYSPSVQNTLYLMGKAVLESFPEVQWIRYTFPNKHHILFDLSPYGMENNKEIYWATNEPYGLIEGTVERKS
jgi:urate oxidase